MSDAVYGLAGLEADWGSEDRPPLGRHIHALLTKRLSELGPALAMMSPAQIASHVLVAIVQMDIEPQTEIPIQLINAIAGMDYGPDDVVRIVEQLLNEDYFVLGTESRISPKET